MIHLLSGAHLTTVDRRNISAIIDQPPYDPTTTYQAGRKRYTVSDPDEHGTRTVITFEPYTTDSGAKETRRYRSEIRTA